jgi:hypothetical protein
MESSNEAIGKSRLPLIGLEPRRAASGPLEPMRPGDETLDYTLVPYAPVKAPGGRLRSVNLLFESFALAGVEIEGRGVVELLRQRIGSFRTVWGTKWDLPSSPRAWELYFYDPSRSHPDLGIERIAELLEPVLAVDARGPIDLPWHMFSVEFDVDSLRCRKPVPVDVYVSTNPKIKGTDRSYKIRGESLKFENVYTFHQPDAEVDEILYRLEHGVHYSPRRHNLARLIPPQLIACKHICVANKRDTDALYFSGLRQEQLEFAARFFGLGGPLVAYLEAHRAGFDHLLWDIGVDYVGDGAALRFVKAGIYGSF